MPELPEVETIARGLAKRVTGDVIESVWLGSKKEPLKSPASVMAATLEHSRIAAVRRMGKHIVFDLESVARAPSPAKSRRSKPERSQSNAAPPQTSSPMPTDAEDIVPRVHKAQWIVHLGMTGRLQVCEPKDEVLKHTHAILKLASGRELRFVDPPRLRRLSGAHAANFDTVGAW